MKFTKKKLEKSITDLLVQDRFSYHLGVTIIRKTEELSTK